MYSSGPSGLVTLNPGASPDLTRENPLTRKPISTLPARLRFTVLGCTVEVEWNRHDFGEAAGVAFRGFELSRSVGWEDLRYRVVREAPSDGPSTVLRNDKRIATAQDAGALLFEVQRDLVVMLQRFRSDLLFFHSSVLQHKLVAILFAAPSGSGKSTTCWGLLHCEGFQYMSDELAPIDPNSMLVYPFPLALSLKSTTRGSYSLPSGALQTSRAAYVPVNELPAEQNREPTPVGAIFFVRYSASQRLPQVRSLTDAEASAFLYPNLLNALAHESMGMDQAIRLASSVPCYELVSSDLKSTTSCITGILTFGQNESG